MWQLHAKSPRLLGALCIVLACGGGGATKSITGGGGGGGGGGGWGTGSSVTPLLHEDYASYSSTSDLLADPHGYYSTAEDVDTPQIFLDKAVGFDSSSQSMRYDFPDRTSEGGSGTTGRCTDFTIGRNIQLPHTVAEAWVEVVARFGSNFTTAAPAAWSCTSASAYKFVLPRTNVSRFQLVVGIFASEYTFGYPGNEEPADWSMPWTPFDGNWHVYRMHVKCGSGTGSATLWVDGVLVKDFQNVTTSASDIYGIALGRNVNQGPDHAQSVWWGKVTVWDQDPKW